MAVTILCTSLLDGPARNTCLGGVYSSSVVTRCWFDLSTSTCVFWNITALPAQMAHHGSPAHILMPLLVVALVSFHYLPCLLLDNYSLPMLSKKHFHSSRWHDAQQLDCQAAHLADTVVSLESSAESLQYIVLKALSKQKKDMQEGELRPQLLDRFGMSVNVTTLLDVDVRTQMVLDKMAYEEVSHLMCLGMCLMLTHAWHMSAHLEAASVHSSCAAGYICGTCAWKYATMQAM